MAKKNDKYRQTLTLPKTDFSMRGNLLKMEPEAQARWDAMGLYGRMLDAPHPKGAFVFHDGPPYANGSIHLGHLLNKILKDVVVRSRTMAGFEVNFVPGWDCHGLPIEHQVMRNLGEKADSLDRLDIRRRCRRFAAKYMDLQSRQLRRLGTIADYENPYFTMDPAYEASVLEVFAELVSHGLVYRALKPVHWSIENRTALAEAELEYYDRDDISAYVLFELADPGRLPESLSAPEGERVDLMIWTTTPWTLPANLAVAVLAGADYALYSVERDGGRRCVLVAEALSGAAFQAGEGAVEMLGRCPGRDLVDAALTYDHPFMGRSSPVVLADYVTLEDGTGLVHTAPGHGAEDYMTGIREGFEVYCPVQGDGTFDDTVPEWLAGKDVWEANPVVLDRLERSGHLYRQEAIRHSYPHDWRGKTPTIFRATEQWFVSVDKGFGEEPESLRDRGLRHSEDDIEFIPAWGRSRLKGMLESRPDWCISRQRSWGLPIPAFYMANGENLLTRATVVAVADHVRAHGSDSWFDSTPEELLASYDAGADVDASESVRNAGGDLAALGLAKCADIFDVWFESGSSWNGAMRRRGLGYPVDLYLEGSDQHRGWFQLSLLPALGATGQPPFKAVLTHGFMVTGQGEKMSKSLGNTLEVEDLLKQFGADVSRWWTASLNYTNDIKVDWEFFKTAGEEYRKVRNTIRFMLGNLSDFDPERDAYAFTDEDRASIDWWAKEEYAKLVSATREAYDTYQFKRVRDAIYNFVNDTMSSVYLAAAKDRLYCDKSDGPRRRRTQTVMHEVAGGLIRLMAPVLVHTADEAWFSLNGLDPDSGACVHLEPFPEPEDWPSEGGWDSVMELRDDVLKQLELSKQALGIKNPLDAGVDAVVAEDEMAALLPFAPELSDLCGVSRFKLESGETRSVSIRDLRDEPRCDRSWKRDETVREREDGGWLSDRDAAVVGTA